MRIDPSTLTPEAHRAIVECLKIAARRGRLLREAREREKVSLRPDSLQNNVANEANKQSSSDDQPQPTNDSQGNRCDSHSGDVAIDPTNPGVKASDE